MTRRKIEKGRSLGDTLDQLLEQAASQQVPSFRQMVKAANLDPARDFVGASLRDMDFRDEDLRGFNFSKADLTGADFRRAKVDGVEFRGAELKGAIGLPDTTDAAMFAVLPRVSANLLCGLMETIAGEPYKGHANLLVLADELRMDRDELFPVTDAVEILRFAEIEGSDITLTEIGRQFIDADTAGRKRVFKHQLLANVPLVAHIRRILQKRGRRGAPRIHFLDELVNYMSVDDAESTLRTVIAWGRYAEAFAYNDDSGTLSLK